MNLEELFETVLKPFCIDKVQIVFEGKIVYLDYPKQNRIYAWVMEKQVKTIYTTTDGNIAVVVI